MQRNDLLAAERGTLRKEAETRIALVYPSPYRAAMSSLGYQQIYRTLHAMPHVAADRAMLPDDEDRQSTGPLVTLETGQPVGGYPMLAYSVAYELEIAGVVETLERANIPVLRDDRDRRHPLIVAGGPLTFSNPAPLAPFCDVIIVGEGEELIVELVTIAREVGFDREQLWAALADRPGYYLPKHGETVPHVAQVSDDLLPARSVIATPHTELADMFMTEAARGCSRGCTYCVMRRSTNGGMRIVARETIIAGIPADARKVGLVGAAVTDHPDITAIVRDIVGSGGTGRQIGISSLRADKLTSELVGLLARGGYRTLTVAADGASERMRRVIERSTRAEHLVRSAEFARAHGLRTLKVYMMFGVPGETDEDIDELVALSKQLAAIHPRVAYGLAPFVAKRNTPLDGTAFAGIDIVEDRIARARRGLKAAGLGGKVEIRATSARWAWVEYMLAQGETGAGLAVMDAHRAGGSFAAYKKAFEARGVAPTGPRARVPSSLELIALRKKRLADATAAS